MFWKKKEEVKEEVIKEPIHNCNEDGHLYEIVQTTSFKSTESDETVGVCFLVECKECKKRKQIKCMHWMVDEISLMWVQNEISTDTYNTLNEAGDKHGKENKPKAKPKKKNIKPKEEK